MPLNQVLYAYQRWQLSLVNQPAGKVGEHLRPVLVYPPDRGRRSVFCQNGPAEQPVALS